MTDGKYKQDSAAYPSYPAPVQSLSREWRLCLVHEFRRLDTLVAQTIVDCAQD